MDYAPTNSLAQLTPQLLKSAVTKALCALLAPIQSTYESSKEWQELAMQAYPPEDIKKPKKQKKDKGSRYPGATSGSATPRVEAQPDGSVEGRDKEQVDLASNAAGAMHELKLEKNAIEKE